MKGHSKYKAVFFDAGGTLFKPHPSVGDIYSEVAQRFGCRVEPEAVESEFKSEWNKRDHEHHAAAPLQERLWWNDLVRDVFSKFGGVKDYESFFTELYDIFARPEYWQLFPEVEGVIKQLKAAGFILGIVSNWDSRLIPLCEGLGVGKFFDFILASGIVGSSKPNAGIFNEALKRSGVQPHEALHVGDSLKDDVQGPARLGIFAVLVDRTGNKKHSVPTIRSLSELPPLLFSY